MDKVFYVSPNHYRNDFDLNEINAFLKEYPHFKVTHITPVKQNIAVTGTSYNKETGAFGAIIVVSNN